ncbi:MAG: sigma-70 family RNA polymerase sigma factor [Lachnospiraceae bacterium]|nr:sigma-70 family RNA polymerase sigma factor [Lachnospiraceae bacterium]
MNKEEFTYRVEAIRGQLYKTAMLYLGSHAQALDALDEAIYKGLCGYKRLRKPEFFTTWMTRILINECNNELRRRKRFCPIEDLPETTTEEFDSLPLKEALQKLPKELKDVIVLRYFSGFTLVETAELLKIPQGTAATRQRKALQLLRLELGEEGNYE